MERSDRLKKTLSTSAMTHVKGRLHKAVNEALKCTDCKIELKRILDIMLSRGICPVEDVRLRNMRETLGDRYRGIDLRQVTMTFDELYDVLGEEADLVTRTIEGSLAVPDWEELTRAVYLAEEAVRGERPAQVAVTSVDGQRLTIGPPMAPVALEGAVKPLLYGLAADKLGPESVHDYVGLEGEDDECPSSPVSETGSLVVASLLYGAALAHIEPGRRLEDVRQAIIALAGGVEVSMDGYSMPDEDGHRRRARLHWVVGSKWLPAKCGDVERAVRFYGELRSLRLDGRALADVGAALAAGGMSPFNRRRALGRRGAASALAIIQMCGWPPAAGGLQVAVIPGLLAVAGMEPKLVLGVVNEVLALHPAEAAFVKLGRLGPPDGSHPRAIPALMESARVGDRKRLAALLLAGTPLAANDYFGRTVAHASAMGGHHLYLSMVLTLCPALGFAADYTGFTPIDLARRFDHQNVVDLLICHTAIYARKQSRSSAASHRSSSMASYNVD